MLFRFRKMFEIQVEMEFISCLEDFFFFFYLLFFNSPTMYIFLWVLQCDGAQLREIRMSCVGTVCVTSHFD